MARYLSCDEHIDALEKKGIYRRGWRIVVVVVSEHMYFGTISCAQKFLGRKGGRLRSTASYAYVHLSDFI